MSRIASFFASSPFVASLRRRWLHPADAVLGLVGIAIGAPSLYAPFGPDQSVFFYVAREWLHGRIPYRDSFDAKPPAIHALHALSIALFGEVMWGIRLFDLIAVVLLGVSVARIASAERRGGLLGGAIVVTSLLYYGFFDYWSAGQCEIWCAAFGMASLAFALRARSLSVAAWAGGAALGVGALFKPSVLFVAPVIVAILVWRARAALVAGSTRADAMRAIAKPLLTLMAMTAAPWVLCLAYFFENDALGEMLEIVVLNNPYYVAHGAAVHGWRDVVTKWHIAADVFGPVVNVSMLVLVLGAALALRRGDRRAALHLLSPLALFVLAVMAVTMQLKFYWYHWGLIVGPLALAVVMAAEVIARTVRARAWTASLVTVTLASVLFWFAGSSALKKETSLWGMTTAAVSRITGRMSVEEYNKRFETRPGYWYSFATAERIAAWLRESSSPDDLIAMRGHEPLVYVKSGRRYPGRFFWTPFLREKGWSPPERRAKWLAEDRNVFAKTPPRFIVARAAAKDDPEAAAYFDGLPYRTRTVIDGWIILERTGAASIASALPR